MCRVNPDFQRIIDAGEHSITFYLDEVAEKIEDYMDKLAKVKLPAEEDEEKLASLRRITDQVLQLIKSREWLDTEVDANTVYMTLEELVKDIPSHTASDLYDIEATLDKYVHLSW